MNEQAKVYTITVEEIFDGNLGEVLCETWLHEGLKNRTEGPSVVYRSHDGRVLGEEYYVDGKWHRDDGPAIWFLPQIEGDYYPCTRVEQWLRHGQLHRDGGLPADHFYDLIEEKYCSAAWYEADLLHRIDGPARVDFSLNHGQEPFLEAYYQEGQLQNESGPAWIERNGEDGSLRSVEWYINDKLVKVGDLNEPQTPSDFSILESGVDGPL